jgi:hydrogenase/urease accessory protein HupE
MNVRAVIVSVCAVLTLGMGGIAAAHPLAPSLLDLRERERGLFDITWKTSLLQPTGANVRPEIPAHCKSITAPKPEREASGISFRWTVDCGASGIVGQPLRVLGLGQSRTGALVRVVLMDGRRLQSVLTGDDAGFVVPARPNSFRMAVDYAQLGVEHILTGPDHLLFVWGLLLLVRNRRALIVTITAFTLGHSVTLALAVLGYVAFPTGLVEFAIALSIVVLAVELASPANGGTLRRRPSLLAGSFGLLHGLGFAGALAEVGLPPEEVPLSLLSFNVGIEAGQLVFVASVLLAGRLLRTAVAGAPRWVHAAPAYAIGSLAVFWCFERSQLLLR